MGDLTLGMDARVGPAGDDAGDRCATVEMRSGLFENRLDGQAVDLALPADEGRAVVFESGSAQRVIVPRLVPGGTGWPRRKASASRAARPGS